MLPGTMVFLLIFFAVMHSWFSIWAEVLNFADRRFYDDWWNSKDYGTFYRKISVTLYEWIHTYIFLDVQRFSQGSIGSFMARVIAFFFSGIICEMILDFSLGFFMPYIFAIIALPGAFMISFDRKRSRFFNVLMWTFLIMLMGLITLLYSLEHFYRSQYPDQRNFGKYGIFAYLIPQCFYQIYY
jgi:sterol O-acyltransferase